MYILSYLYVYIKIVFTDLTLISNILYDIPVSKVISDSG